MSELRIRPAVRADLPTLGRLGASLLRLHHGFDADRFMAPPDQAEAGYAWFLGTQLNAEDVVVLVATRDEAVVGYAYAGLEPMSWKELRGPAGFVHDVVVDEAAREGGVATALVEAAVAWLEQRGAPRTLLMTADANAAARRLFTRLGFRATMIEMTRERRGS
jgi:ribosomal protein S18 acetylase RimI-like enzyme